MQKIIPKYVLIITIFFFSNAWSADIDEHNDWRAQYDFTFPAESKLAYSNGRTIDVSGLQLNLAGIFDGGIGRGANSMELLAHGMEAIGSSEEIVNLPYSIYQRSAFNVPLSLETKDGKSLKHIDIPHSPTIKRVNLALDIDGHASLASFSVNNGEPTEIFFYDSLRPEILDYSQRYSQTRRRELLELVFPKCAHKEISFRVIHVLDQGGENSNGCGYFTLYTAMLIKHDRDFRQDSLNKANAFYYFTANDDKKIRASIAIITFLHETNSFHNPHSRFIDTAKVACVFQKLKISEHELAQELLPLWLPLNGDESMDDLWRKYQISVEKRARELEQKSAEFLELMNTPANNFRARLSCMESIFVQAVREVHEIFVVAMPEEHFKQFVAWTDERGLVLGSELNLLHSLEKEHLDNWYLNNLWQLTNK